ncbi:hypothetical protein ACFQU7_11570 [Pseudoroseomonas wenyumeiae]
MTGMRRYLLLAWVTAGLAIGGVLALLGDHRAAAWAWSAAAAPAALHVGLNFARSLMGGRLGVDVIAFAAILGAVALGEAAAAAVIALMVSGGEALEAWAEGRATRALTDLMARAHGALRASAAMPSRRSRFPPSAPATCCWCARAAPCPPMACWRMPRPS